MKKSKHETRRAPPPNEAAHKQPTLPTTAAPAATATVETIAAMLARGQVELLLSLPAVYGVVIHGWHSAADGTRYITLEVTPAIAAAWLSDSNRRNRRINPRNVARLEADLRDDRFLTNGDTVSFDARGCLANGQHRCTAIVNAGKAVVVTIVTGLASEAQRTQDRGHKRRDSDDFEIEGGVDAANSRARAAWLRIIKLIFTGTTEPLTQRERDEYLTRFRAGINWASDHIPKDNRFKRSAIMGTLAVAYCAAPAIVDPLLGAASGVMGHALGTPATALHVLVTGTHRTLRHDRAMALKVLSAARAAIRGQKTQRLEATEGAVEYFRKALGLEK